jgi:hypothetical protein
LLAGFSAPIAAAALLAARHLRDLLPFFSVDPVSIVPFNLIAIHLGPIEFNVLLVAGFVLAGFALGETDWCRLTAAPLPANAGSMAGRVAVGLIWVAPSFSGWNAAPMEEAAAGQLRVSGRASGVPVDCRDDGVPWRAAQIGPVACRRGLGDLWVLALQAIASAGTSVRG